MRFFCKKSEFERRLEKVEKNELKELRFDNGVDYLKLGFAQKMGDNEAASIATSLTTTCSSTIKVLSLFNNEIGDDGAASIASALRCNTSLLKIDLERNRIGPKGAAQLASALAYNTTVQDLRIGENRIRDEGAASIASALKGMVALRRLCLNSNSIGDDGAASIASALTSGTSLQELSLGRNRIGRYGAMSIALSLGSDPPLLVLDLSNNSLGSDGTSILAAALVHNTVLQRLDIECVDATAAGAWSIESALHSNHTLKQIDLFGNGINDCKNSRNIHHLVELNRFGRDVASQQKLAEFGPLPVKVHSCYEDDEQTQPSSTFYTSTRTQKNRCWNNKQVPQSTDSSPPIDLIKIPNHRLSIPNENEKWLQLHRAFSSQLSRNESSGMAL